MTDEWVNELLNQIEVLNAEKSERESRIAEMTTR